MKTTLAMILVVFGLGSLAACNTIKGAGRDIQGGGKAVTDTADEVQEEITE